MPGKRSPNAARKRVFAATPPAITNRREPCLSDGAAALDDQCVDNGVFERSGNIGFVLFGRFAESLQRVQGEGLEPAEAEVEPGPIRHGAREAEASWIAALGEPRHGGSAGVTQPEHLGGFIERLARGVVDRLAEDVVFADRIDTNELRVSPETSSAINGTSGLGSASSGASKCASMW